MYCIILFFTYICTELLITFTMEEINTEKIKTQMRKGILEMCILSVIDKSKEAYVSDLIETMKNADMIVVEGTLYPLLTRLKNSGLLNYQWKESPTGPPRKYYVLTDSGKLFLSETLKAWRELQTMIDKII